MKLFIDNVESERERNKKFAEENDISQEEMEEVYQEIYKNLPEELTGDKREARALRKARNSLKRIVNSQGTLLDGFILMRFQDNDFEANTWRKVDDFVKEHGIDEARAKGMINEDGDYIHSPFTTQFANQHGKVIDPKNVRGSAIGIVTNDGVNELRWLNIGKFAVNNKIPLCREVKLGIKEGNQPGPLYPDRNAYFLNNVRLSQDSNAYYSEEDFQAYADLIEQLCGDIAYYTKGEINEYANENSSNRNNFIVVPVHSVIRIGAPLNNGNVPIDLEIDDDSLTVWASKNVFKDLTIEEGIQGIAMINTYVKNDGEAGCRIGGFLPLL